MPVVGNKVVNPQARELGEQDGAAWAPVLKRADFRNLQSGDVSLAFDSHSYCTPQAYAAGVSDPIVAEHSLEPWEVRNIMREDPDAVLGMFGLMDKALRRKVGGTIVAATLPGWMYEPMESAPAPVVDPDPQPES
ncbi:MAG: hypothetical protein BGO49_11155 [Planctomycetales bacterium 71-10]|nr:MAG: hypothetical protein BGO49_11155 [Planctomycetales bacterium 71-10]